MTANHIAKIALEEKLKPILLIVVFFISCLVVGLPRFNSAVLHNFGMLNLARSYVPTSVRERPTLLTKARQQLTRAAQLDSSDVMSRIWLANLYVSQSEWELAAQLSAEALLISHRPPCYIEPLDPLRMYSLPQGYVFPLLLPFNHPQSTWQFFSHYLTRKESSLTFADMQNGLSCIARIQVQHPRGANHFSSLQQPVWLKPEQEYQLTAWVRATGLETAWLGVSSAWGGQPISNTPEWQLHQVKFTSSKTQPETILFVVESGFGTLEIKEVHLARLPTGGLTN